jgi:hypothetical protein
MSNSKRIFSISMVKNEMDIIESFVRYHVNIFDGMIFLDNGSTDKTVNILNHLKNEGLAISIFEDDDGVFNFTQKINQTLLIAAEQFKADIIVPLDADEFLISSNKGNPRKILEKIEYPTFSRVKWKTFVPTFDKNKNKKFVPSQITFARDDSVERYYKAILPRELVEKYNVELANGSHDLTYEKRYDDSIERVYNTGLRLAHYPIRSKEQTISKIVVGWINELHRIDRNEGENFHWQKIFDKIKKDEKIDNEDVVKFAKEFALKDEDLKINITEDPIDLTFCSDLKIIYTKDRVQPISNLLERFEILSRAHTEFKRESIANEQCLNGEINDLSNELSENHNEKVASEKFLNDKIMEYKTSLSWRITSPMRRIGNIIRNLNK